MKKRTTWWAAALVAGLATLGAARAGAQGVHVALLPATQDVATDAEFTLELWVTEAGSGFNGFDAVVSYDPADLTFLPTSPTSLQEGSYMTGACGSTFPLFHAAGDSLAITDVLLCSGVSLPGPGQIYKLRFKAASVPRATQVRIRSIQFYDAGLFVNPAFPSDATIYIGMAVGVPPGANAALHLAAAPNPFHGAVGLTIDAPAAGLQSLTVRDVAGRTVRHLDSAVYPAGTRRASWDGRDDLGRAAPAGLYWLALRAGTQTATRLVTRLP